MRQISHFSLVILLLLFIGCKKENQKIVDLALLAVGDSIDAYTIKSINLTDGIEISFNESITVKGTVYSEHSPNYFGLKCENLFQSDLKLGDKVLKLSEWKGISFSNETDLLLMLDSTYLFTTTDGKGIKPEYKDKISTEINLSDFVLIDLVGWQALTGKINYIKSINGKRNLLPYGYNLEKYLNNYQQQLDQYIMTLEETRTSNKGLFYSNNIEEFEFYKNNAGFADFVYHLFYLGYNIVQTEGNYFLEVNPAKVHKEAQNSYSLSTLKNDDDIRGLAVHNLEYKPKVSFSFNLGEEFIAKGKLNLNLIWYEYGFSAPNEFGGKMQLEVEGKQINLFDHMVISNPDMLEAALTNEQLDTLEMNEDIKISLLLRNYKVAGKINAYNLSQVEFIKIVHD